MIALQLLLLALLATRATSQQLAQQLPKPRFLPTSPIFESALESFESQPLDGVRRVSLADQLQPQDPQDIGAREAAELLVALPSSAGAQVQPRASRQLSPTSEPSGSADQSLSSIEAEERDDANLLSQPFDYHASMPVITKRELTNAIKSASQLVEKLRDAHTNELPMEFGSSGWLASSMFHKPQPDSQTLNQTQQALVSEEVTRILAKQYKLSRVQTLRGLPLISVDATNLGKLCPRASRAFGCIAGQYRSLTGHCNNVQNPDWGSAQTPLLRYAPARYLDHVSRPVKAARTPALERDLLPSSRAVSLALHGGGGEQQPHSHMTTMMSFFGQFVFHDLAYVSQFGDSMIRCCGESAASAHPECMPIELRQADGDHFCLDYVRSTPAVRAGCNLGPRDQLNLVSSFLDGSTIYGSNEATASRLRTFSGGRLRSQRVAGDSTGGASGQQLELLPQIMTADTNSSVDAIWAAAAEDCRRMAKMKSEASGATRCFQAGDDRVNENIGLTLMHTIWVREHNYIADKLSQANRHWRDERIFEEARRLVIAELQHITYTEFLPALLGAEMLQRFNLTTLGAGYSQSYDPQLNAGLSNELASAVFPFILTTIPAALERYSERLEMVGSTRVAETFMDGSELFKRNKFAQYLTGMISQSAMEPASGRVPMTAPASAGSRSRRQSGAAEAPAVDAVALALQQGRDHGLKPYLYYRRLCQVSPQVRDWAELAQVMPAEAVERLRKLYASVDQLDLYLGVLERPRPGASLGPTFVCLLARQFYHLKHGDRYWFENDLPASAFTPSQLDEIRQTSLAKVVCRNSQASISFIQPAPLLASDPFLNAYQYCTNRAMVQLDLGKWREPVTSAQQLEDERTMGELGGARLRRMAEALDAELVGASLRRARRALDALAYEETVRLRRRKREAGAHSHAGYRYLPRPKRQALKLSNQSLVLELATNDVVRALVHQGKDREQPQSLQSDIRDFLNSLESVQLDNLIDNSATSAALGEFIAGAGANWLTPELRTRLKQADDPTLAGESGANCQDDERAVPCDHTSPFRTITGWCNNLQAPKFGQSFTPLDRLLANAYEDGLAKPRRLSVALASTESGERLELPSPRLISTKIHDDRSQLHVRYSLALMQFGQFGVDHDLTRTPFAVATDGSLLDCSSCDSRRSVHRECLPIRVPDDDAHFQSAGARAAGGSGPKCLHFVRSLNGQTGLGPRQQINALTAYIDASNIYGSDNCEAKSLRAFAGGRLNSSAALSPSGTPLREMLPVTRANPECVTPNGFCFHAGDQRASEQPGLSAMHTIFMRLHNSIAGQLAALNRHWGDERLYQNARKIVGAIAQRITYAEFAPRLLGLDLMSRYELMLRPVGYSTDYDDSCSGSILTEFAAAAFRMGHSLIRGAFPLLNRQYKPIGKSFQLRKAFFNSQRLLAEPSLVDAILRGVVSTPIETLDNTVTEELTNHLFERPREPFSGMDLVSLNIQRARDHGVPGYNAYRAKCNLTRARTFEELGAEIPAKLVRRLASVYAHVDDIDLFTGGMSELPVHGGIIGPTLGCIIGLQLQRLKRCDRFWHETGEPWVRFSAAQLAEIRKVTLARVICQESDQIDAIQRSAMDVADDFLNPRVPCASLPAMDLGAWRESLKSCQLAGKLRLELGQSKRVSACRSCTCTAEGAACRTVKVNCAKLMRSAGDSLAAVLAADKSCLVQCAWALDAQQV